MNKLKRIFIFTLTIFLFLSSFAQRAIDLRINELFINNVDNLTDEYGRHVPWVEIFNTSYNNVNIAECYLTNDTTGLASGVPSKKWYRIPKGDPKTIISQRGYLIFYLDNTPSYGVFHTNFNPKDSLANNYIALISSNGRTLIHFFSYNESLKHSTHSYGYRVDFGPDEVEVGEQLLPNLTELKYFTPGSPNNPESSKTKAEELQEKDQYGIGLILISMTVVFTALFIIFVILKLFARFSNKKPSRLKLHKKTGKIEAELIKKEEVKPTVVDSGEELAAISLALHSYLNSAHDHESEVITIETPSAHFSPWSQKQLMTKRLPKRR
jgi:Na+-transporting methylmalonyl-CoA/oxaloacetate decarboxylase gamma subunit